MAVCNALESYRTTFRCLDRGRPSAEQRFVAREIQEPTSVLHIVVRQTFDKPLTVRPVSAISKAFSSWLFVFGP